MSEKKFPLGRIVATPGALDALTEEDIARRHQSGNWGELCESDRKENEVALQEGLRLLSAYTSNNGTRFWVITEADRSATTFLLPEEY